MLLLNTVIETMNRYDHGQCKNDRSAACDRKGMSDELALDMPKGKKVLKSYRGLIGR